MKVIHLSTSDLAGGAAIACKRIVDAQSLNGIESTLLVQRKVSSDPKVFSTTKYLLSKTYYNVRIVLDEVFIRLFTRKERGRFSNPVIGLDVSQHPLIKEADVINFQWINGGFISLNTIEKIGRLGKPIVWTLHDMWAFTGGCHYVGDCDKFISECRNCPALKFRGFNDLSTKIFRQKIPIINQLNLTIVTTSRWLAGEASQSNLFSSKNIIVIPTPIDSEVFKPIDKNNARAKLKLPHDKKIILLGAMNLKDKRKGFSYLIKALKFLKTKNSEPDIEVAVFGKIDESIVSDIHFKINQLGSLKSEEQIVSAYNSADVFIAPSLEDNLPNTIMEAMACGTPILAFNVGGISDMVDDGANGLLVQLKSIEELAKSLMEIISDDNRRTEMSKAAREKVLRDFNPQTIANRYRDLYKTLIQN